MEIVALWGFLLRFMLATAGLVAIVWTFRYLNRRTGDRFDEALAGIVADPKAAALYFGLRALGVFLYYGTILG